MHELQYSATEKLYFKYRFVKIKETRYRINNWEFEKCSSSEFLRETSAYCP